MKLLSTLILVCALAVDSSGSAGPLLVCPLSDAQVQKSIEAFSKMVPTLTGEPRCTGCHGRVNPFIEGTGPDPNNPAVMPSQFAHGPGAVDITADCNECHSHMARRSPSGEASRWLTAPPFLEFPGKDARTLCEQIRDNISRAENFVGHITNDNGFNNFAGTAFNGDRGLDRSMYPESEVPTEKPAISHEALIQLGKNWIATTDDKFQGDKTCGCEPAHYAVRVSVRNEINTGINHHTSALAPVDIPITFADDGSFSGDGVLNFHGAGSAGACSDQTGSQLSVHVSGKAEETADEHSVKVQFAKSTPTVTTFSAQCPYIGTMGNQTATAEQVSVHLDFTGEVGETRDYQMPGVPGVTSTTHVEIVKLP
jgi:hypothetical protein